MQLCFKQLLFGLALACFALPTSAETVRRPSASLASEALAAFLSSHKGPILDVSYASDCAAKLARTSHRVPFDHDHADPVVQGAANELFVDQIRRLRRFVQVNRNQTPVLVVCCGGVRSAAAARVMARMGFNVVTLDGGLTNGRVPPRLLKAEKLPGT